MAVTVNEYTYGTVDGMHRRIGWLTEGKTYFDGDTDPTLEEVVATLDDIASDIHINLAGAGYPVNTNAALTSGSPRVQRWLQTLNEDGAAAFLGQQNPIAGNPENGENNPVAYWKARFKAGLKLIAEGGLDSLGLDRGTTNASLLFSGSSQDENGNDKLPIFKRNTFDYPGSRSLTD